MNDIAQLIEKYLNGYTSLEEEARLSEYFQNSDVIPEKYTKYKSLFTFFSSENKEVLNEDFEKRFLSEIKGIKRKRRKLYYYISTAAACILIVFSFFLYKQMFVHDIVKVKSDYTSQEIDEQYKNAKSALMLFSLNFNKGMETIQPLSKFNEGIEQMEQISKFHEYKSLIFINNN